MRLLLIRHGQTTANAQGLLDTAFPGAELTSEGLGQAQALVPAVTRTLSGGRISTVWTSDLTRTQQTAGPLADHLGVPLRIEPGFREIQAGDLELVDATRWGEYIDVIAGWFGGDVTGRIPGGENGAEVLDRFDRGIDAAREQAESAGDEAIVVVSHGAVLRSWIGARASNVPTGFIAHSRLENTAVLELRAGSDRSWVMTDWAGVTTFE